MLVIPAIDLIEGQCVRLARGDYSQKTVYGLDPVKVAREFEREGATWLHVVDLDGAKEGLPVNLSVVEEIVRATDLKVEFGGGLRSVESVRMALSFGVERAVVGTRVALDLREAELWFREFGDRILASIDTKEGFVAVHGWEETATLRGVDLAKDLEARGCRRIMSTDIATDGMLSGPNIGWMEELLEAVSIPVIASGGVASLGDIEALATTGCEGVIVGKALYEERFRLRDAIDVSERVARLG